MGIVMLDSILHLIAITLSQKNEKRKKAIGINYIVIRHTNYIL